MGQKRFSIPQGGDIEDVTVATDATSIGSDVMRLIVIDTPSQKEVAALIEKIKDTFLQQDYPF